ncbi:hypothetical protein HNR12_002121 [Streptomonospora nanhaiensis]|uniref:Uncharacterized protein n=1 Tax=Streptomonospora nanhaiensis TaxID=1323731 RepID=A0A853BMD8_9ACTN|nr:hypothetical protein [Streptomonospora nanhaiensis]NYI95844.1 hypothetical protein [Streptomonospora nanhaiensis]
MDLRAAVEVRDEEPQPQVAPTDGPEAVRSGAEMAKLLEGAARGMTRAAVGTAVGIPGMDAINLDAPAAPANGDPQGAAAAVAAKLGSVFLKKKGGERPGVTDLAKGAKVSLDKGLTRSERPAVNGAPHTMTKARTL